MVSAISRSLRTSGDRSYKTPTTLGPGSYSVKSGNFETATKFARAPFSSTQKRSFDTKKSDGFEAPGPGSYFRVTRKKQVQKANANFQSKTKRETYQYQDTPGPGSYALENTNQNWKSKSKRNPKKNKQQNQNAIVWVKVSTAPSIPAGEQSHGYEEGPNGELIRQKAPYTVHTGKGEDTIGPGHYNPQTHGSPSMKSKGTSAFRSTSKRTNLAATKTNVPGPGSYSTKQSSLNVPSLDEPVMNSSSFASKSKRTNWNKKSNGENPGPGTYGETYSSFNVAPNKDMTFQNFGSSSVRLGGGIGSHRGSDPGPGHFIQSYTSINTKTNRQNPPGLHGPFQSTAERFQGERVNENPGPGQYYHPLQKSFVSDVAKRGKVGAYGVFGTTSRRFVEKKNHAPGVGAYNPSLVSTKPKKNDSRSAAFASQTRRSGSAPRKRRILNAQTGNVDEYDPTERAPPPGSYNVTPQWIKPSKSTKAGKFGSQASRFSDVTLQQLVNETPGPGRYNDHGSYFRSKNKKHFSTKVSSFSNSNRFGDKKKSKKWYDDTAPAPGAYHTNLEWDKKTFNISIAEPTMHTHGFQSNKIKKI
mmetsp:Transcript_9208/g.13632  ORF Transcript_9208/g.13632 Transcript_9208/m.13632 type:complete len:585 (+) Transcript_9208:116-1870(+)|eukprot:CAMPEP_0117428954 /NCGR_PEP_ID=MMETSP0758-20121206/8551_1 /TAXON_ID=63605 /ORGANISM="Percolomonas cosmopolitus, Strain AE-1 (ATCC 50343)" /LENGTH=584 /DNA_ID=CAMNT_0005215605 /DNA_START=31 /DNA_END=1785 /DNA_ORIENTATION=+